MRLLADLCRRMDPRRFSVRVLVLGPDRTLESEFPEWVDIVTTTTRPGRFRRLRWLLMVLAEAWRNDLLVGWSELTPTYIAWAAGKLARKRVIGWVHTNLSRVFSLGLRPAWAHRPMISLVYRDLYCTVGVSAAVSEDLQATFGIPRVVHIPNCVDLERVTCQALRPIDSDLEEIFDIPVLISVGVLCYEKAQDILIRAHRRVLSAGIPHRILLVGDGPARDEYVELVQELSLRDTVVFAGWRSNPYPLMRRSTGLVLSSRTEGFAIVLAEALAVGLPIVASDCPSGPREILADGQRGLLVAADSVEALSEGMEKLLAAPEFSAALSERGRAAAEDYSAATIADRVMLLLLNGAAHA